MQYRDEDGSSGELPRCSACDDVVGVYEPLVHTFGRLARRTSRAVEPGVFASGGECYHLDCYERLHEES
jgi:phage major head subunit gpT-like protein